jgi:Golgi CORVET complex core vacuolar protein 8
MSLDVSSVFYEEAIQTCTENKLYRALAYVCSTHGDFISPLNKLLSELRSAQTQQLQQAQQIYYDILKDYIEKLL